MDQGGSLLYFDRSKGRGPLKGVQRWKKKQRCTGETQEDEGRKGTKCAATNKKSLSPKREAKLSAG